MTGNRELLTCPDAFPALLQLGDTWVILSMQGVSRAREGSTGTEPITRGSISSTDYHRSHRAMLDPNYCERYAFRAGEVAEWLKAAVC